MTRLPTVDDIARALTDSVPNLTGDTMDRAAVAIVLRQRESAEVLLVERACRPGDPWSGDLAFPGGRMEPCDADAQAAAVRETGEEVGLDLSAAHCLGRLDDRQARIRPLTICAFVYAVDHVPALALSDELTRAFWVPVGDLLDAERRCEHELVQPQGSQFLPALDLLGPDQPLLWGVTYAFLQRLLHAVGHPLPPPPPLPVESDR